MIGVNSDAGEGIAWLSCGIEYDSGDFQGVDVLDWTLCASGNSFPEVGPNGAWPASEAGIAISWLPGDCQDGSVPGYDEEGAHAIAGAFYVTAYGADTFSIIPNTIAVGVSELYLGTCEDTFPNVFAIGSIGFGSEPGFNPCTGEGTPPPPPPPPPPPTRSAAVMLHIGDVVGSGEACSNVPSSFSEIVTSAEPGKDYFVYLLGTSEIPLSDDLNNPGEPLGLAGIQLGIAYEESSELGQGLSVSQWNRCSDLDFPDDVWPASGTGNTITWVTPENCRLNDIVVAGYFYVSAYTPAVMSIVGFPHHTGVVKVANCEIAESVLEEIPMDRVGWVSLGGAKGVDTDGCNPTLESCSGPVPVLPTTWGRIKTIYVDRN